MGVAEAPKMLGVRLTRTERGVLEKLAEREELSLSGMVRQCILREAVRPLFGERAEHEQVCGQ